MRLIPACTILKFKVSCCLHMYFLWRHHLPRNKSENDQDSDSDWLIDWFTYCIEIYNCWHCFLVFNIWVSRHALDHDNNFLLPNSWVVLFFIYTTFQNFVPVPTTNNDRDWPVLRIKYVSLDETRTELSNLHVWNIFCWSFYVKKDHFFAHSRSPCFENVLFPRSASNLVSANHRTSPTEWAFQCIDLISKFSAFIRISILAAELFLSHLTVIIMAYYELNTTIY
jgi:hypothetical protein